MTKNKTTSQPTAEHFKNATFAGIIEALRNADDKNKEIVNASDGVGALIAKIYRSGTDSVAWLEYFTREVANVAITAKEVKLVQNNIGKLGTQRKMLSLDDKAKPTQRVRLMKGNKTLLAEGLCTQAQLDSKSYLWIVDGVKAKKPKTAKEKLQAIVDEFNIESLEALQVYINEIEFN